MRQLKHLSLLLGLLLLGPSTYAQSVRFQSQAISTRGAGIANATVAVCTQPANTNTQPCSPLATLATSTSTTSGGANPLTADSFGNFFFYAAPGRYTVQIYGPAVSGQFVIPDVAISCDPAGPCTTPGVPFTISGTGTVNVPTFEVAQTGAINTAGTINGITEGCALPANAVWNIMLNLNQCDAGGGTIPSLPLYVQANPSGSQTGNTQGANWSIFEQMKCVNFTGNGAFMNCQGNESEAFYQGTLAVPNNLQLKALGGQVWIDNSTTATTAAVPFGISVWGGAPFYNYASCGASCGTGNFQYAVSVRAEQPTASDSKGNAVGVTNRAALQIVTNSTNDPGCINFDKTGTTQWTVCGTANASAQPFDFSLQNNNVGNIGIRFQNSTNGNIYAQSNGTGSFIINGNPTFAGEGVTTNGTGGLTVLTGGGSGSLCAPSTTGIIRLCNNTAINFRNVGNTTDQKLIGSDNFNDVLVGDANTAALGLTSSSGGGGILIFSAPGIGCNTGGGCSAGTAANPFSKPFFSNCTSSASPAVCGANSTGSVAIAAAATTLTVNTTSVTANSVILLTRDDSLGTKLSVTCNTATVMGEMKVSARTAGTSFTITVQTAPVTNPGCVSYTITN